MRVENGWLDRATRIPSPHRDARPAGAMVELVVVHGISLPPGEFGGPYIERLFTGTLDPAAHPYFREIASFEVSSHLLIGRDGSIVQFVSFDERAWHAGRSSWRGREECNDYSIGIELEGCDEIAYAEPQYRSLAAVLDALVAAYPTIAPDALAGHDEVAPGRKTDPGPAFDRARLAALRAG